jgi:acyl-CoA dehydrogenase
MCDALYPLGFGDGQSTRGAEGYLQSAAVRRLIEFFDRKGLAALKEEDRREDWYQDWIDYQAEHRLYAGLLSPKAYSRLGHEFDLSHLARFWEVFAYFSPAHGYSLHVSFLGLFPILMSENEALKKEAIQSLEEGGLFAFGVSEKRHGSDLLSNEFTLRRLASGRLIADGSKYYIGNANAACIISILAKTSDLSVAVSTKRAPFAFFALRPQQAKGFTNLRKIRTLGVRTAYVGEFDVAGHELPDTDIICQGRSAWDAMFGTVTLGKFLLGFASIGICEHALQEALAHARGRTLFGKFVIDMPHIRAATARAYARLTAMKLYAYRALDYLHAASVDDRRYLLFCAVQKAKVSIEGVRVMAQLAECLGAKGFESDTYFESALRDIQLIPTLEGSTHLNYTQAAQFLTAYLLESGDGVGVPGSRMTGAVQSAENPYLMSARTGGARGVAFGPYLRAYRPLSAVANVRRFVCQAKALRRFAWAGRSRKDWADGADGLIALGRCLSTLAYAQLVAEQAVLARVPLAMVAVIFEQLVESLGEDSLQVAALTRRGSRLNRLIGQVHLRPRTTATETAAVGEWVADRAD